MSQGPAYRVETDRLLLRCWDPADAPSLREALDRSDAHFRPWIPFMKDEPRSLEQTAQWLRELRTWFDSDQHYRYAVFEKASGALAGENMLLGRAGPGALEIGYLTHVGFGGKGYADEATRAMIRLAFEVHEVDRIEIHCSPQNTASAAIPERLGFTHEATLERRFEAPDGVIHDTMLWTLFASGYAKSSAAGLTMKAWNALGDLILDA